MWQSKEGVDETLRKITVVTGAAAGLGRAVALRFADEGAVVVAADANDADGASLAGKFSDLGCEGYSFEPTSRRSVR